MRYLKDLMLSRSYFTRIPDQSLIVGDAGTGEQHIGATRDKDGSYAMIYVPQCQSVKIDFSKISGLKATGWWYDPRTGVASKIEGDFPTAGTHGSAPIEWSNK